MFRNCLIIVCIVLFSQLFISTVTVSAEEEVDSILFIYTNERDEVTEDVQIFDLTLHHFSENVTIVSSGEVTLEQIEAATAIVYYGEDEATLSKDVISALKEVDKKVLAIGENIVSFMPFQIEKESKVKSVGLDKQSAKYSLNEEIVVYQIADKSIEETLLYGYDGKETLPLLVQNEERYIVTAKK